MNGLACIQEPNWIRVLIVWLMFGIVPMAVMIFKGHDEQSAKWFWLGLFFPPVPLLLSLFMPRRKIGN